MKFTWVSLRKIKLLKTGIDSNSGTFNVSFLSTPFKVHLFFPLFSNRHSTNRFVRSSLSPSDIYQKTIPSLLLTKGPLRPRQGIFLGRLWTRSEELGQNYFLLPTSLSIFLVRESVRMLSRGPLSPRQFRRPYTPTYHTIFRLS